jgi:hypothetical protein
VGAHFIQTQPYVRKRLSVVQWFGQLGPNGEVVEVVAKEEDLPTTLPIPDCDAVETVPGQMVNKQRTRKNE